MYPPCCSRDFRCRCYAFEMYRKAWSGQRSDFRSARRSSSCASSRSGFAVNYWVILVCNWVLLKEPSHESRIQICTYLRDLAAREPAHPAVTIIESEPVLRGGQGMKFNYRPISAHEYIFNMQLRALRQHLGQFGEGTCDECLLAELFPGKRVRSLHNPVPFVGYMFKKRGAIALL